MDYITQTRIMKEAIKLLEKGYSKKRITKKILSSYTTSQSQIDALNCATKGIEMYVSLRESVNDSGGVGWNVEDLCKMTVMDLISRLATNNVRFVFRKC